MTVTASAAFHFNTSPSLAKHRAEANETVALALDSVTGVREVLWEVAGTDGIAWGVIDYTIAAPTATNTTIDMLSTNGQSIIIKCTVNASTTPDVRTAKIWVPTDGSDTGLELGAAGETTESDSTYGFAFAQNVWAMSAAIQGKAFASTWKVNTNTTGTLATDASTSNKHQIGTLPTTKITGDVTMNPPSGIVNGQSLAFRFFGDGAHRVIWNAAYKFGTAGTANADPCVGPTNLTNNKAYIYRFEVTADTSVIECVGVTLT